MYDLPTRIAKPIFKEVGKGVPLKHEWKFYTQVGAGDEG